LSKPRVDGKKHVKIPLIGGISVLLSTWFYAVRLLVTGKLNQPTVIYSRNVNGAFVFLNLQKWLFHRKNIKIYFEVHSLDQQHPKKFFHKLLRESTGLICITKALKDALVKNYHIDFERILVASDGVRKSLLESPVPSKEKARQRLNITAEKIVLYTGQLLPGKGAHVLLNAASFFDRNVLFVVVGGNGSYLERMQQKVKAQKLDNVWLTGFVSPTDVPMYQAAADVLVLPPTADHDISPFTSPLKLFEYMAARRPIVASALPVLEEILQHGYNALLFQEQDAADLAAKIEILLQDAELAESLARAAWKQVQDFTWEKRAQKILDFIQHGTVV
jgi:glycosyltransferase involved in cell wall biosynthesis